MSWTAIIAALKAFWAAFIAKTQADGAREERAAINKQSAEIQQRRDEVIDKPVTDDELRKSLKDGSF